MRTEIDRRAMTALSGGHLFVDFASGTIPALIPFITAKFDLSYAHAALLMLCVTISSSLVQPLFGLLSDRRGALWLIPGGVALAGAGAGLAAVSPVYPLVLVLVFASGIGIAAFHPEGAKFATYASGLKRASGMAYFNIGGNTGYALGRDRRRRRSSSGSGSPAASWRCSRCSLPRSCWCGCCRRSGSCSRSRGPARAPPGTTGAGRWRCSRS